MTAADRDAKRALKAAARAHRLEQTILRDWRSAVREDKRRRIERFCQRELGMSLEDCIESVRRC
jgi:transposase-like protein